MDKQAGAALRALGINSQTTNLLLKNGISSIEQIAKMQRIQLLRIPGFGHQSNRQVSEALRKAGLSFPT